MNHRPSPDSIQSCDVLVLGAGLAGLAAATVIGDRAVVLERDDRPGGLVRTECFDGYWFDRVIHLLYFPDPDTERWVRALMNGDLAPCPPEAWVETQAGTARFPLQLHLGRLDRGVVAQCLRELAALTYGQNHARPGNFQEMLELTFGPKMCEIFFYPYNLKMWKRPLSQLAPSGFTWNIARPEFDKVLMGALSPDLQFRSYNAQGFYPRPEADAPQRGMEVLAQRLSERVHDLRLGHRVESIRLQDRVVTTKHGARTARFHFRQRCCCTLPLPRVLEMCDDVPASLLDDCRRLTRNRVLSVALSVRGPRPVGRGHWRYYADESICFTRLVYMHEFDPDLAPPDGWGLLAEITEPAEQPMDDTNRVIARVIQDIHRVAAIPSDGQIVDARLIMIDPAYVVFTVENQPVVEAARAFLREHGIEPIGRYGRWEYSSMGQVLRDAFNWAQPFAASRQTAQAPRHRQRPSLVEEIS